MLNLIQREQNLTRIIEADLTGAETPEAVDEAIAALEEMDRTDPPARALFTPYRNAEGQLHAAGEVLSIGGRSFGYLSTHYLTELPAPVTAEQTQKLWDGARAAQETKKAVQVNL